MQRPAKLVVALALASLFALLAVGTVTAAPEGPERLTRAVSADGILQHERQFQRIATENDNTRTSGTPGYDESAQYVAQKLRKAGYVVDIQRFEFILWQETAPSQMERLTPTPEAYVNGTDFATMSYSGSGEASASIEAVDVAVPPPGPTPSNTSGCEDADFESFTDGNIALLQRGTCSFGDKALNAQEAGASGVIIFNEGQPGRDNLLQGTLGMRDDITIPVVGTTYAVGEELYTLDRDGDATVRIQTFAEFDKRQTSNVLSRTRGGDPDRTVVVGAHLDSVDEGPGINDNGSGSATILEIAEQMAKLDITPRNRVRFAFWGAEESGLIGSTYYVNNLSEGQLADHFVNLNFDMVGSPNFVRFVYDGDGSDTNSSDASAASGKVERVFNNYFASRGLETDPTAFDGRSDYQAFTDNGIPAGGLFSGAEGIKSAEQAATYGGTPGAPYDPCYHQACDTLANLNNTSLNQLSDGAAYATYVFAKTQQPFPEEPAQRATAQKESTYLGNELQK